MLKDSSPKIVWLYTLLFLAFCQSAFGQQQLKSGGSWSGTIAERSWKHFVIDVRDWESLLKLRRHALEPGVAPEMYVRLNAAPNLTQFDHKLTGTDTADLTITNASNPVVATGKYYIGLYARQRMQTRLDATVNSVPSSRSGMGATPYNMDQPGRGTSFRVWAPNAETVHVAGDFNQWQSNVVKLQSEGNGHWSIDYRNVVPNQQYKYVIRNGGQTLWRNDPREEQISNSVGNSVIFDPRFKWRDTGFQMPPWNELVIYQMHIGTFNDVAGGRPGDLKSANARLDHLKDLGVNAIQLLPVHEFAGDFSWGYNPSYPFTVEEAYGGPQQLKTFVDEAHMRGMAVILDIVHNHWGPSDLDAWRFDGWSQNNRGGIYFYQDNRAVTPWGDTRPDFGRAEVRQYIRDQAMMFLNEFRIDGFRWDSTVNIRSYSGGDIPDGWSLMQWINDEIDSTQPWKISIAEDLQDNSWLTKDTGAGGAGFDSQWNAAFVHPVRSVIELANDDNRNMDDIRNAVNYAYSGDKFERVIYTESHDEVANGKSRVPETIWPGNAGSWFSRKRSTLGGALVMTAPGIPMMFQGQEFLEDGYFQDTDPLDWSKSTTYSGIQLMYRDLIRLRRNWNNNTKGLSGHNVNFFHQNNNEKVVAFHRWANGGKTDDVVVVMNFRNRTQSNYRIGLPRSGVWRVRFNSDWTGYSSDFGNSFCPDPTTASIAWDGLAQSGIISIAPYSILILSQDADGGRPSNTPPKKAE